MAFQYLFAPTTQFQARTGANNTAGFLRVFYTQTDDRAVTYSDFGGTENEADIVLDNDGRAVVIVDDSKTYRLEVYGVNRNLLFTVDPLTAVGGGSGGANITNVVSTDGTVAITVTSIGGMVTYDLSTAFEDNPSSWGNALSMISDLDGTDQWVQIPVVSSVGSSLYDNGWTAGKDTGYDIAASVEMPTGSNTAIYGIDVKCEVQVDGVTVLTELGRIDPTTPMDRVSFEWKGELTKGQKVDAKLYVKNGEAITLGIVGRALFNEECDGIVGGGGGNEYIPGEYIDISTANVISVTGVQPLSGMSAYQPVSSISAWTAEFSSISSKADQSALTAYQPVSAMSGYATEAYVDAKVGGKLDATASSLFLTGLPDDLATTGDVASAVSGKMDKADGSAFYPTGNPSGFLTAHQSLAGLATVEYVDSSVSSKLDTSAFASASAGFAPTGDYAYNSSLSAYYPASASGAFQPSGQYQTAGDYALNSAVSSKLDASASSNFVVNSAMTSWIPYSALDYSGTAISGIGGSSLAGMGGGDYTGIYPVNVDNTAREISVDSLPLVTDSSMTSYASGDSSVIGVNMDILSGKLDSSAQVVTSTATQLYAGTAYLTSINGAPVSASRAGNAANASLATSAYYDGTGRLISSLPDSAAVSAIASAYTTGKQDTLAFGYDGSGNISSIDGSSLAGQGGEQVVTSLQYATSESGAIIGSTTGYQAGYGERVFSADCYPYSNWQGYQSATSLERLHFTSDRSEVTSQIVYPFDLYMLPYGATNQGNIYDTSDIVNYGALSYGSFYGPEDFRIATGVGILSGYSAVLDFDVTSLPFNTNYGPVMWGHDVGEILDDDTSKKPVFGIVVGGGSNEGRFLPFGGGSSVLDFGSITTVSSVSGINTLSIMGIGGTGGIDSATCSAIASAYAESAASSKQDTLAFAYNTADQISSINGSALGGMDEAAVSGIASAYAESAASGKLDASASSSFYSTANESGFITGVDLSPYQTTADMSGYIPTSMSSDFQQVTGMSSYALSADVSATVDLVGTQSANWGGSALALSAGPGVKLEKVGDTLVASTDETVLFSGQTATTATMNLNEAYTNFEYIDLIGHWDYNGTDRMCAYNRIPTSASIFSLGGIGIGNTAANSYDMFMCANEYSSNGTSVAVRKVLRINLQTTLSSNSDGIIVDKIIGINRTAEA